MLKWCLTLILLLVGLATRTMGAEPDPQAAERGYRWLTTKAYLPPDFDQEVFDALWRQWPEPLRSEAKAATPAERRKLAFARYGMVERPGSDGTGPALGYVDNGHGGWVMNCLTCHSGQVAGQAIPGLPNANLALATLTEDVRATKLLMGKKLSHLDLGSVTIPLGGTRGTTNSVIFGVALGAHRDQDLNFVINHRSPEFHHHDMDAPPFWNVRKKTHIYADGFCPKDHKALMQFMMVPQNSGERLRGWEAEFRDVLAWIESLQPPPYPHPIDRPLAEQGHAVFIRHCSKCHGTYGDTETYPGVIVPLAEIGTDPVRLQSLTAEYRRFMAEGWFGEYGKLEYITDPGGYAAPPLDGVWATAPYFHNGSVPTLWDVLHADQRPGVWRREPQAYDVDKVGLKVQSLTEVPKRLSAAERREYFDTSRPSKSASGHRFPDILSEEEKRAVLEYLKTL